MGYPRHHNWCRRGWIPIRKWKKVVQVDMTTSHLNTSSSVAQFSKIGSAKYTTDIVNSNRSPSVSSMVSSFSRKEELQRYHCYCESFWDHTNWTNFPILENSGIPQITQTAYRKGVSCQDSIFTSQEANEKFTSDGDTVYTRVYDLASAFNTVEFSVLLEKLFNAGIRGKSWRFVLWSHQPSEIGKSPVKFLQYLLNPPELCTLSLIFFLSLSSTLYCSPWSWET